MHASWFYSIFLTFFKHAHDCSVPNVDSPNPHKYCGMPTLQNSLLTVTLYFVCYVPAVIFSQHGRGFLVAKIHFGSLLPSYSYYT